MATWKLGSSTFEVSDDLDGIYEFLYERGLTDGLPVIPPTEDRIQRFLDYLKRDPSELIAEIPIAMGVATIEKIVINAIMAGCRPEYLPVVITAVEAMVEPKFNLTGIQPTTNPVGPCLIINGPIRKELDVACGSGCLGPGWRANATIGRAIRLILLNLGGARPGEVDQATQGWPGKYTFCFGENEEESPWEPLHVERGFTRDTSTVTVVGASGCDKTGGGISGRAILLSMADCLARLGSNNVSYGGEPLAILNPMHARVLGNEGWTKPQIKQFLYEHTWFVLEQIPPELRSGPTSRGKPVIDGRVALVHKPEDFMVVVAGGPGGLHSAYVTTFGETWAVTKPVRKPDRG